MSSHERLTAVCWDVSPTLCFSDVNILQNVSLFKYSDKSRSYSVSASPAHFVKLNWSEVSGSTLTL